MNCRVPLLFALLAALACSSPAQKLTPDQLKESDRVLEKIRKVEIYNQLLPVLLTGDQAKLFLPILEKHRADADKIQVDEHRLLLQLEKELDVALQGAEGKGELPDEKTMKNALVHFQAFIMKRKALIDDTVSKLLMLMHEKLNAGQIRAAANAFNPAVFGMDVDKATITEDKRLDYWIRIVLIDNTTYPILVELSKKR
jgi:hypothetical protein